jgi:hypothetical protein
MPAWRAFQVDVGDNFVTLPGWAPGAPPQQAHRGVLMHTSAPITSQSVKPA